MADETERVEYVFEGDVSSLRTAAQTAIDMLNRYSDSMRKASTTDAFTASQRSSKSMNASIGRLTKDIEKMQAKLKSVGDVKLPTGSAASQAMSTALSSINDQMQKLNSTDAITTKTLTNFRTQLEGVRSSLQSTAPQVDRLISSEQRFQNVLSAVQTKADQFRSTMESTRTRISETFEPVTARLRSFSAVFDGVSAKVQSFRDRASTAFSRVSQLAGACASAFRRVSQSSDDADASASRTTKSHRTLSEVLSKLTSRFKSETEAIAEEKEQLDSKESTLDKSTTSHSKLLAVLGNLGNKFKSEAVNVKSLTTNFGNLSSATNVARKAFTALVGVRIGDWLAQAAKESISYIENLNLFVVAMGESIEQGLEFVDTMQEIYGMDPSNLYRYAGYFYQLTDAIGMTSKASATLSLSMTKAANDIASLFNIPIDQVVENLASGMQGMSRAVRKYGMDIRTTTLQQTALKYGLDEQVETMSEANRMALRYITMMEQVSNATQQVGTDVDGATTIMGDFARTIETPANQLRIFKEQITQLGRAIGNFLVAPLANAMAYINGFIMALRMAINFIASLLGFLDTSITEIDTSGADDATDSLDGIGAAADDAASKIKDLTAPFDELNVLQEQSGTTEGLGLDDVLDPALEAAIANMELKLENIRMKANDVRDAFLEFFGFTVDAGDILTWDSSKFEANLLDKFPEWSKTIQATFDNWSDIIDGFKAVFESLGGVISSAKEKILGFFGVFVNDDTVSTFTENLGDNLQTLADWISSHEDMLSTFAVGLVSVVGAFKAFGAIQPIISLLTSFGSTLATVLSPFASFIGIAAAVAAAIIVLYNTSDSFATSFNTLLSTLWEGLSMMGPSLLNMLETIGVGLLSLWDTSIKPTLEALGDALAPVLETLGSLWLNVSEIISGAFDMISRLWTSTLQPVFEALFEGVQSLCHVFKALWEEFIGPVVEYIGNGLTSLWNSTLSPIIEQIIEIIGGVIEVIMGLWNNVLAPVLDWIVRAFGPSLTNIFKTIWDVISQVFNDVGDVLKGLLTSLKGVIDFLAGVFTGDWTRAWHGLVNIFVGVGNAIISVIELALNGVISLINMAISLIYNAVVALINSILGAVKTIASLLGFDLNIRITAPPPAIPTISFPRIPELATGGVVTSPTYLLAGEGHYDEAIIPLGNSPQMEELVAKIADAVDKPQGSGSNVPIDVRVFIGDKEWDVFTYKSAQRGEELVGAQPIKIGG
ncbi:MAG: hypothetical protein ACI4T5_10495 [Prevotella sp.]